MKDTLTRQIKRIDEVLEIYPNDVGLHNQMESYIKIYVENFGWEEKTAAGATANKRDNDVKNEDLIARGFDEKKFQDVN